MAFHAVIQQLRPLPSCGSAIFSGLGGFRLQLMVGGERVEDCALRGMFFMRLTWKLQLSLPLPLRLFWLQLPAEEPGKCSPVACPGRKGFGDHTVVSATGTQEANNRASQTLNQLFLCLPKHMLLLGSGSVSAGDLTPPTSRLGEFSLTRAAVLALNSPNTFWLASPGHLLT